MPSTGRDRVPYVGSGEDGARRSAKIDRNEAAGLSFMDDRRDELLMSADRWEDQAHRLVLERVGPRPTLDELRREVGSEEWLAALALLSCSPALADDAAGFTEWSRGGGRFTYEGEDQVSTFHPNPQMDWEAWAADVDEHGRGWSSTESRLYQIVVALTAGRPLKLVGVLDSMGSWEREVLDILVQWASGGNNRELPGRLAVTGGQA